MQPLEYLDNAMEAINNLDDRLAEAHLHSFIPELDRIANHVSKAIDYIENPPQKGD